jgi:hypothetical protein
MNPSPVGAVAPTRISVSDIRAKLAKAKEAQAKKARQSVMDSMADEIADAEAEMKMSAKREAAVLSQIKQSAAAIEDFSSALAEAKQNRDALDAIGEDSSKIIAQLEEDKRLAEKDAASAKAALEGLLKDRTSSARRISEIKSKLAGPQLAPGNPAPASASSLYPRDTYLFAQKCRDEIKSIFAESEKLPIKLSAFDSNGGFHVLNVFSARAKEWETERAHLLSEEESTVLRRVLGASRTMAKQFMVGYVDPLSPRTRPREFSNWTDYLADAVSQYSMYFSPTRPPAPPPKTNQQEPETPKAEKPVFKAISQVGPARPIVFRENANATMLRLLRTSGVSKATKGKRVAVIAGLANRNETLREFIESAFEFSEVRWYDRNLDDLATAMQALRFDLLLVFPHWHKGYHAAVRQASAKGIRTITITEHNRHLICQRLAKEFGYEVGIPEKRTMP